MILLGAMVFVVVDDVVVAVAIAVASFFYGMKHVFLINEKEKKVKTKKKNKKNATKKQIKNCNILILSPSFLQICVFVLRFQHVFTTH